ncbi:MAG: PQQ-binding-like beta-propeller repeat protein [Verrucomicrobiota bacterium]
MKSYMLKSCLISSTLFIAAQTNFSQEWPSFRGPTGDGISPEKVLTAWPAGGPKHIWQAPTPNGLSAFAIGDGKAFVMLSHPVAGGVPEPAPAPAPEKGKGKGKGKGGGGGAGVTDVCMALDASTGQKLWEVPLNTTKHSGAGEGDGARATPAVDGNRVYVYSDVMVLMCLDTASGKTIWKQDILNEFGGQNIGWNSAMSPMIDGDLVYVAGGGAGQAMLAFNKTTGALAWKSGTDTMTHATPVIATIGGEKQVIFFLKSGLVAVNPKTGAELWKYGFPFKTATAASPIVCGDIVFCSAGYGVGGAACQVTKTGGGWEAKELWMLKGDNSPVATLWSTPVHKDGYLYGVFSYKKYGPAGLMKCVEVKTGKVMWEQAGFGAGQVILAGNCVVALTDDGQLVLVEPKPDAYKELARAQVLSGKCWTPPSLSKGRLYLRGRTESVCLDVAAK